MSKASDGKAAEDMRSEYDFSGGVRGKYVKAYAAGTNLVLLDADVAAAFPDGVAVNEALRALIGLARRSVEAPAAPPRRKRAG